MNQISRPMQIALGAVLVFAVLWFVVLKPGEEEPVIDAPIATSAPVEAGGAQAQTGMGQAIESANEAAVSSDAANAQREAATGENDPNATTTGEASGTVGGAGGGTAGGSGDTGNADDGRSASQKRADGVIRGIESHLNAGRAVVFLIWQRSGTEDKLVNRRLNAIDRRGGRVRLYKADVKDVGLYEGLIGGLSVSQTPSTIVIAPNKQAKVLGGLVSTVRIDRLTSSALVSSRE